MMNDPDQLAAALRDARDGLLWYQERFPEVVDGSDDEAMARIEAALAAHEAQPKQAPTAEELEEVARTLTFSEEAGNPDRGTEQD